MNDHTTGTAPRDGIRAYVNGRGVTVPPGATALDALDAHDASFGGDEGAAVREGRRRLTDSRGLPCAPDTPLAGGSILRVVAARARLADGDGPVDASGDGAA